LKAEAVTPRDLFDSKVQYEIPAFQRPYVWTEEDQWSPLWADVRRVAESCLDAMPDPEALEKVSPHFLGAVVIKEMSNVAGDLARSSVIDGQQRMTTLQLLLDAAQVVVDDLGNEDDAEALQELVLNDSRRFRATSRRFKLWPSRTDREPFLLAMDDAADPSEQSSHRIRQAHRFFQQEIREWSTNAERPESTPTRLSALTSVLSDRLFVVAINLSLLDDDQLIFETLNDRGTPLLAADLVKNWMFQQGELLRADVDLWAEKYWLEFDEEWWREQISQGRLLRSRIDIFLQYWLTMRTQEEVPTELVFKRFREHAKSRMLEAEAATEFVQALRRDADTFRSFAEIGDQTAEGKFYRRVIEALELGATTPLLLWFVSDNHNVPRDQVETALASLESWVVRRTLLRRTTKDVNKLMVSLLKELDTAATQRAGASVRDFLAGQTSDSREWPTDQQMLAELPSVKLYGNVRQSRLRVILAAVEFELRDRRLEDVSLPGRLEVEHIMPQGWRSHWRVSLRLEPGADQERDQLIHTLGNLTLTTQRLNSALSNRPWTDDEARLVAPDGIDAGKGKRSMLSKFSILAINKAVVDEHPEAWSEDDIRSRSAEICSLICQVWPRG
jgi:hypothetical protein